MFKINSFMFSSFFVNTYLIWDDESLEAAVIDPACIEGYEKEELRQFILVRKLNLKYLINTHCHLDHVFGNKFVKENFDVEFLVPDKDIILLDNLEAQANIFNMVIDDSPRPDKIIDTFGDLHIGNSIGKFIFTPGHTPGEFCLYFEEEKVCFTGDVLFREGIGRTDIMGGNSDLIQTSIKTKLLTLPEDVIIYPGHGESSTIGHEKIYNTFIEPEI